MARKGSTKVRTGCFTCKVRKIKCDETKPHCQRCTKTGRKCDGYAATRPSQLTNYRPLSRSTLNVPDESRNLQFFFEAAAPHLSGPVDPYFWKHVVMQLANSKPAVRHATLAISLLYEELETQERSPVKRETALRHYNCAIHKMSMLQDQSVALLVCLLFICIEFLQSDRETAIQHCNHGIAIINNCGTIWARQHLAPIFRRLSLLPLWFGSTAAGLSELPMVQYSIPPSFQNLDDAQFMMDDIFNRTIRLARRGDAYRLDSKQHAQVPPSLIAEQHYITSLLGQWQALFEGFDARSRPLADWATTGKRTLTLMRYDICQISSCMAFTADETRYDQHMNGFRRIVDLASSFSQLHSGRRPPFIFEMGFTPALFFVIMKCRSLEIRLEALRLMRILGSPRESLWEGRAMCATGEQIIQIEHGVVLDHDGNSSAGPVSRPGLTTKGGRVEHFTVQPLETPGAATDGRRRWGRRVNFFTRSSQDEVNIHTKLIVDEEHPVPLRKSGTAMQLDQQNIY
ncbi:c6 zinc finger domain [Fusarium albosuccineum]|uniref:C6 zinc finger domain n=1 Tax=Fusarium albosuccineum TaxID=1237068 RepID=A0A8H4LJ04_9HYPO|nr:c6 zinc finger domain [Fusarium albosuccineum]